MFAKAFANEIEEEELRDYILALLYGPENLEVRLKRFLEWSKVETISGAADTKKRGITPTVVSYLLAISNPKEYAYCKPNSYKASVTELLGKDTIRRDPVERIIHCTELYKNILDILEKEYGLKDGNLLDVHSLVCFFNDKGWGIGKPIINDGIDDIYDLLIEKSNMILYGPPGTGKTMKACNWPSGGKIHLERTRSRR
ncbi:MAG: hypothetical protein ACMUIL_10590 [bacterium]